MSQNAEVKFNSKVAETRVKLYAREIGNLRTRLKEASTASKSFGSTIKSSTNDVNHMSRRVRVLTRDMEKLSTHIRKARKDVLDLGRAMDSAGFKRGAAHVHAVVGPLRAASAGYVRASTSARTYTRAVQSAGTASLGYSRRAARGIAVTGQVGRAFRNANVSALGFAASLVRVRNLALFLAGGFGVQGIVEMADTYKLVAARLDIVSDSTEQLNLRQSQLIRISNATRTAYKDNAALFVKLAQAGEQYGVSQEKALTVTENVAKAMKISGASASEAQAATQQLAQAFASGRIQGDELRSVLENSPRIAKALSTELADMGINLSNIRDAAAEGKIGINELVRALGGANITRQLAEEFEKIPLTIGDSITVARNKIMEAIGQFDAATGASDKLASSIVFLADNISTLAAVVGVFTVGRLVKMVTTMAAASRTLAFLQRGLNGSSLAMAAFGTSVFRSMTMFLRFAGPIGVVIGLMELYSRASNQAENRISELSSSMGDASNMAGQYFEQARMARISQENLTKAQQQGVGGADRLAGASAELAAKIREVGASAQWSALQTAKLFAMEAQRNLVAAGTNLEVAGSRVRNRGPNAGMSKGGIEIVAAENANYVSAGNLYRRRMAERNDANAAVALAQRAFNDAMNPPKTSYTPAPEKDKSDRVRRAKETKDIAKELAEEIAKLEARFNESEDARQKYVENLGTLSQALDKGVISQDKFNRMAGELTRDMFTGLADKIKEVTAENEKLMASINGESDDQIQFRSDTEEVRKQIETIDYIVAREGDKTGELTKQKAVLGGQIAQYEKLLGTNRELTKINEQRKKDEEAITRLIDESANRLFDLLTRTVSDALSFNRNSFKNFFRDIFGFAKDTFASILSAYVFQPLQERFRIEMEKALKSPAAKTRPQGGKWSIAADAGIIDVANDNEIVVEAKMPRSFMREFVAGYKEVWKGTFDDLKSILKPFVDSIGNVLKDIGIDTGALGKTLGKMAAGAQFGAQVGQIGQILGLKKGASTGGAVGGAVGSLFGPIGTLVGSIGGSIIGSLLTKTKTGSTTITGFEESDLSTTGNSRANREASIGSARNVQDTLKRVADQLGGSVGSFRVSIGKRNNKFRVDPTGRGQTKTKKGAVDFGEDEEAAIRFAIKTAIEQGAIKGLRASTSNLLRNARDIEDGLQEALDFENVFRRLKERTDPIGAAFDDLGKEFERLTRLFEKAGATSEEWSQLGELFQKEIQETIKSQLDSLIAFRDDLIGGDRSFKSPTDRLALADAKFREFETKIAAGEKVNQEEFTNAGQALQALAREVYGSTPEFQLYQQRLMDSTNRLITSVQAEEANLRNIVDAINAQSSKTNGTLDQTNNLLQQLVNNTTGGGGGGSSSGINYSAPPIMDQVFFGRHAY